MRKIRNGMIVASTIATIASNGLSDLFELDVDSATALVAFDFTVPFSGTLIGDFDPKTNPGGTQTRPGLFGGSGNNAIGCELDLTLASSGNPTSPSGSIELDFADIQASLLRVDALDIDLLGEGAESIDGQLTLVYQTFNTVNPSSIYLGGIPIPIPIAGADILRSELRVGEPTTIFAVETKGGVAFDTVLAAIWTIEFDAGTGSQVQELPVVLPFVGTVTGPADARTLTFGGTASNAGSEPLDVPIGPIPVPLPTLPPGGTANLLFSGAVTGIDYSASLEVSIVAMEVDAAVFGDLDGDGLVGSADLGLMIAAWGPCPGCLADLNGDGMVDAMDLGELFAAWSA